MRLIRFRVTVNQGSTVVFSTTVGGERGAKGAAVSGNRRAGILVIYIKERLVVDLVRGRGSL